MESGEGRLKTPSRTPEWLADLMGDRRPARSHVLQFTLAQRRKIAPQACARSPDPNGRYYIVSHDDERIEIAMEDSVVRGNVVGDEIMDEARIQGARLVHGFG